MRGAPRLQWPIAAAGISGRRSFTSSLNKMLKHTVKQHCLSESCGLDPEPVTLKMDVTADKVQKKPIRLIVATCNNMGIGKDGKMPWNLPCEFQNFMNHVTRVSRPGKMNLMIWGRLCWFSNPKTTFPIANTLHAVLSNTMEETPEHAHFLCPDLDSAAQLVARPPLADVIETIWVVGGTQVYEEAMKHPWCDLVYMTDVMADFDCDVFFPKFDRELFQLQEGIPHVPSEIQEENGIKYKFQVFKKVSADAAV